MVASRCAFDRAAQLDGARSVRALGKRPGERGAAHFVFPREGFRLESAGNGARAQKTYFFVGGGKSASLSCLGPAFGEGRKLSRWCVGPLKMGGQGWTERTTEYRKLAGKGGSATRSFCKIEGAGPAFITERGDMFPFAFATSAFTGFPGQDKTKTAGRLDRISPKKKQTCRGAGKQVLRGAGEAESPFEFFAPAWDFACRSGGRESCRIFLALMAC